MDGSSSGDTNESHKMEQYDYRLCRRDHEQIDKELAELYEMFKSHDKTLRGGNGDGPGIVAEIKSTAKIVSEWQAEMRKLNIRILLIILGVVVALLRDYIITGIR
jgi:hypothetical protein